MHAFPTNRFARFLVIAFDAALIVLTWCNIEAMRQAAELPAEYHVRSASMDYSAESRAPQRVLSALDGHRIEAQEHLPYLLGQYAPGDTVAVVDLHDGDDEHRVVVLVAKFSTVDIISSVAVGMVFLIFALYVVLMHRRKSYAGVLHALAVGTAVMVLFDWGSTAVHPTIVHFLLRLLFDCAIWLLPALFFHFSCAYPTGKQLSKGVCLVPWYAVSIAGIILSAYFLVALFYYSADVTDTWYSLLHGTVNDVFLLAGLLGTIASFEHSALRLRDARQRRDVYWVLLGIMFGPLVYVFMILVPRMLLGYELVSDSIMQYTLVVAPLMFWKVLRQEEKD
jgi:hypothetical protein